MEQADTSNMASESTQTEERSTQSRGKGRSDPNKLAAPVSRETLLEMVEQNPFSVKIIVPVPKDFKGCKCPKSRCLDAHCHCLRGSHPCTSRCTCKDCANSLGVRGSDSSTEPEQEGTGGVSNVPEGVQIILSPTPPPARLLASVIIPVPKDFKGCKCPKTRCVNGCCHCWRGSHPCTSRCTCKDCDDFHGVRESDSSTEPEQEGTGGVSNIPDEAVQIIPSPNIETEPADDTSSMKAVETPRMEDRGNKGFDLNQLPSSNTELAQADDTSSKDEEPAQAGEHDTESRDNMDLDQNKRRRSV